MERGFLDNNLEEKNNNKDDLDAKIINIDGKVIGRKDVRGIRLDNKNDATVLDTTATEHAHVYAGVKPLKSILKTNQTRMRVSNEVGDVPDVNIGNGNNKEDGDSSIAGTSFIDSPQTQDVGGISKNQIEDVINEGNSKGNSKARVSFASMVSESVSENAPILSQRINFRSLVNEERVVNHDMVLPKAAKESVMSRYANTLVGYFVGKSLAFHVVQNYVSKTWAKFGLSKLMKTDNGEFLFKFDTKSGMDQVIERCPWLICNTPLILNKWAPNMSLKPGEVNKVPVWVKLYNVPVVAYSEDGLSLIATQIGKPIMLDIFTSSMCVDSWGRISFARALIEISANSDLKKEVRMAILIDEDDVTEHNSEKCPKKVSLIASIVVTSANDGFTEVVNRKNKGKKANDNQSKKKTDGNEKASTSHGSEKSTPISNSFSVLNEDEGAVCEVSVPSNDGGTTHNEEDIQNPKSGSKDGVSEPEKDSLWSKFKAAKEASKSNPRSLSDLKEESDEDEVYFPNEEYTSGLGGGFSLEEDDLDGYDGYESQIYDIPGYDIRLNSRCRK
ncbi:putative reverse transcriptase domain, ribonuclease H-like domain, aspartic peptidase domain protein [Tanacetum coccineum]